MTREHEVRNLAQRITALADWEEHIALIFSALVESTAASRTASPCSAPRELLVLATREALDA